MVAFRIRCEGADEFQAFEGLVLLFRYGAFEGKHGHRSGHAAEDLRFKTFHIDLDEPGRAVLLEEQVQGGHPDLDPAVPVGRGKPGILYGVDPFLGKGGQGMRVGQEHGRGSRGIGQTHGHDDPTANEIIQPLVAEQKSMSGLVGEDREEHTTATHQQERSNPHDWIVDPAGENQYAGRLQPHTDHVEGVGDVRDAVQVVAQRAEWPTPLVQRGGG